MRARTKLTRDRLTKFEEIPNIGPAMAADFRLLGLTRPQELRGKDPYALYDELCRRTGVRQDPCVIDVFIAAVRFMEGKPAKPWWAYTAGRKREMGRRKAPGGSL